MKTLSKVLLCSFLISLLVYFAKGINPFITFVLCLLVFGIYVALVAIKAALKIQNADESIIQKYNKRVESFKKE